MDTYTCFYSSFNQQCLTTIKHLLPNANIIETKYYLESLKSFKSALQVNFKPKWPTDSKVALLLPQYYQTKKANALKKKIQAYHQIMSKLLDQGYVVAVKDHPKFTTNLKDGFNNHPNVYFLDEVQSYPVELVLDDIKPTLVISVYSTSLITASSPQLFNIPAFSTYNLLDQRIGGLSVYAAYSCWLIKKIFPDINLLLKSPNANPNEDQAGLRDGKAFVLDKDDGDGLELIQDGC